MKQELWLALSVLVVCLSAACLGAVFLGCGFVHRAPATPCQNMICEAVDFGGAVKVQICAGPADLQRIHSEARQLRALKAMKQSPPGDPAASSREPRGK